jgi:hypothetical protein
MTGYVVESPVYNDKGERAGTARVWFATEARAIEVAAGHPSRTYRAVDESEMPEKVRANMRAAHATP